MAARIFTDEQLIDVLKTMTNSEAARHFKCSKRNIERRRSLLVRKGWSPEHDMTHIVPDGYRIRGVSSLYKEGQAKPVLQWVKSSADLDRQREIMQGAIAAMAADLPQLPPRPALGTYLHELHTVYPLGDQHIGEYIWAAECGKSWDLDIATKVHCGAIHELVSLAPASSEATIIDLGDAQHFDSLEAVTPRSGHLLDADGRYPKVIDVSVMIMRQCIESALSKHEQVNVICVPGNHNPSGAFWMSTVLHHMYAHEPRVKVDREPSLFRYLEFGKCLVGVHHGHSCKPDRLPSVMATDQAKAWGRTEHRYWYMGHVHHQNVKEHPGCIVESFNTLVPGDSYAHSGGWRSKENMKAIVLHREHGEVIRHTVNADMFRDPE